MPILLYQKIQDEQSSKRNFNNIQTARKANSMQ